MALQIRTKQFLQSVWQRRPKTEPPEPPLRNVVTRTIQGQRKQTLKYLGSLKISKWTKLLHATFAFVDYTLDTERWCFPS